MLGLEPRFLVLETSVLAINTTRVWTRPAELNRCPLRHTLVNLLATRKPVDLEGGMNGQRVWIPYQKRDAL